MHTNHNLIHYKKKKKKCNTIANKSINLQKISHLGENVTFWRKCYILEKMLHFGENVTFWRKCYILEKMLHFGENVTFWRKCHILEKMSHFGEKYCIFRASSLVLENVIRLVYIYINSINRL